jgi:hypothetical protein
MWGHTRIFHNITTQHIHVEASHKAPQCTHLSHVSTAAVFSHAVRKLLLQIPPFENSLIQKTQGKQIQRTKTPRHNNHHRTSDIHHSQSLLYTTRARQLRPTSVGTLRSTDY